MNRLCTAAASLLLIGAAPLAVGQPQMAIDPPEWDFGEVWYGEPLQRDDIVVKNVGDQELRINSVRKSCGCTAAEVAEKVLAPGETTTLKVGYDSKKNARNVNQVVTIYTNEPNPTRQFRVRGTVKPLYSFENEGRSTPVPTLSFGQLDKSASETKTLKLTKVFDQGPIELKLDPNTAEDRNYSFELKQVGDEGDYELLVTTKPPLGTGNLRSAVKLRPSLEEVDYINVVVNGFVMPKVRVSPTTVYVSPSLTFESSRDISVMFAKKDPVEITEVSVNDERVKHQVLETPLSNSRSPNAYHRVRLTLPSVEEFPEEGFLVTIKTDSDDPDYSAFEIPVRKQPQRPARLPTAAQRAAQPRQ